MWSSIGFASIKTDTLIEEILQPRPLVISPAGMTAAKPAAAMLASMPAIAAIVAAIVPGCPAARLKAAFDDLVEFAAVEPYPPTFGTIIDLDVLAFGHYQGKIANRALHAGFRGHVWAVF